MAEQRLDVTQIGAAAEQMRRARVPQRMWSEPHTDPAAVVLDACAEARRTEAGAIAGKEERRVETGRERRPACAEVRVEGDRSRPTDGDDPILAPFTIADEQQPRAEIEIRDVGARRFAEPEACAVEQLEDCAVAQTDRGAGKGVAIRRRACVMVKTPRGNDVCFGSVRMRAGFCSRIAHPSSQA